jgi:hypothetical protein
MPRKKVPKEYFTKDTEDAILEYNKETDKLIKDKIYRERIKNSFEKLTEIVFNKWGFTYFDDEPEDVMSEVVTFLVEKIHMYNDPNKGKAYSYFTIVARNYLILNNNSNYKRYKDTDIISKMPESWDVENNFTEEVKNNDYKVFNKLMLLYWDKNLEIFFQKKRDVQIADSVLELFRRAEYIENFNKKSLYLLVREMTGHPTHYITKVINKMREKQIQLFEEFMNTGNIQI